MILLCAYIQQLSGLLPSSHKTTKAPIPVTFCSMGKVLCAHFADIGYGKG